MPCVICGKAGPNDAAHVKTRGAGGDKTSLISLCRYHHFQQHTLGIETFAQLHGVDLHAIAAKIAAELAD